MRRKTILRSHVSSRAEEYVREYKKLAALHDRAPKAKKDQIFDRMTEVLNLVHKAYGQNFRPIRVRFSQRRAV
jgi:hypothetical protein